MIEKVKFIPPLESTKKMYYTLKEEIEMLEDWCISENNVWGIPIPSFKREGELVTSL